VASTLTTLRLSALCQKSTIHSDDSARARLAHSDQSLASTLIRQQLCEDQVPPVLPQRKHGKARRSGQNLRLVLPEALGRCDKSSRTRSSQSMNPPAEARPKLGKLSHGSH